jgi:hypothetical protein
MPKGERASSNSCYSATPLLFWCVADGGNLLVFRSKPGEIIHPLSHFLSMSLGLRLGTEGLPGVPFLGIGIITGSGAGCTAQSSCC